MAQFYSYLWLREDGTPEYVGKGTGKRAYIRGSHHLCPPKDKSLILIFPQDNEADAIQSEKDLISLFGRKDLGTGILRNFTAGGDGVSGLVHSEDAKRRMSAAKIGKPGHVPTPEHLAKMAAGRVGKKRGPRPAHVLAALHSPESIAKSAASRMGHSTSTETRQKISLAHLGMKATEETRRRISESHLGHIPSLESRQKLRVAVKQSWILRRQQGKTNGKLQSHPQRKHDDYDSSNCGPTSSAF